MGKGVEAAMSKARTGTKASKMHANAVAAAKKAGHGSQTNTSGKANAGAKKNGKRKADCC